MTSLLLGPREAAAVADHLGRAHPEEGCGLLLGREHDGVRQVREVVALDNDRPDSRRDRYAIAPERFLEAEKRAREAGLEVLGFFHSHPDRPAEPSRFDLENAWPYYSYLIASVARGRVVEMRCWRLAGDGSRFDPERLILEPELGGDDPAPGREGDME